MLSRVVFAVAGSFAILKRTADKLVGHGMKAQHCNHSVPIEARNLSERCDVQY